MKFLPTAVCVGVAVAALAAGTAHAGQVMRLADCPILPNTVIEDCNAVNYVLRIGAILVPGLLLALGTLIAMFIYCAARCCCGCCGGGDQVQSYTNCNCCGSGCCCEGGNVPARYSYFEIARVRATALALIVLGVIILVYGVVAAGETQSGITSLLDAVANPVAGIIDFVNELDADLTVTLYNDTTDETYERAFLPSDVRTQVDDVANSISGSISDVVDKARAPIKGVVAGIFAAVIVPACILVLIAAMGVFNVRKCGPMLAAALLFVLVFIVWVLHAVVGVLALLVGDVSAEVQGVVSLQQNVITALVPCPTDAVNTLRQTFDDFTTEQLGDACQELSQRCYWSNQTYYVNAMQGRTFDCSGPSLDCSNPTSAYLYQLATVDLKVATPIASDANAIQDGATCDTSINNCTLKVCAVECRNQTTSKLSSVGKMAKSAVVMLEAALHVEDVIERNAGQLYVCEVLIARVVQPFAKPLEDFATGSYNLRSATGLEGIFCTFAIFVCAWGAKRFLALEEAGRLQHDQVLPDVPKP